MGSTMNNSEKTAFEEKGTEIAKRFFSGHPTSAEELDLHNVYWQYVQVNSRGLERWLRDCEAEEPMNTSNSLKRFGLDQVAELTVKAMSLLAQTHSCAENSPGSDSDAASGEENSEEENSEEIADLDRQYLEYQADIFAVG